MPKDSDFLPGWKTEFQIRMYKPTELMTQIEIDMYGLETGNSNKVFCGVYMNTSYFTVENAQREIDTIERNKLTCCKDDNRIYEIKPIRVRTLKNPINPFNNTNIEE